MAKQSKLLKHRRAYIILVLLVLAAGYVAVPQLGLFGNSWNVLLDSNHYYFGIAVLFLLISYGAAALIYRQLSVIQLPFAPTYLVQIAGSFASKVLPVGLGSISVSYLYLRSRRLTKTTAATIVAVNNLLGFLGHSVWLVAVLLLWNDSHSFTTNPWHISPWILLTIILAAGVLLALAVKFQKRFRPFLLQLRKQLRAYQKQPSRLVRAFMFSILLTGCYIAMAWLSARALDLSLTFQGAAIALTVGMLAQTVTPTPGGIGGVEVGVAGGLTIAGLPLADAVSATILYRFVTFWIPLVIGGIALWLVVHRRWL